MYPVPWTQRPATNVELTCKAQTYFAYPKDKNTENAILILTDVLGHDFINAQLIADQFAANGYLCVMPDLFHGDPAAFNREGFDLMGWLKGHPVERVDPVIEAVIKEMRGKMGVKRIGGVGYCFGGKYVVRNLQGEGNKLDVGYIAHPSFVEADELKAIEGPLSISAAGKSQSSPPI